MVWFFVDCFLFLGLLLDLLNLLHFHFVQPSIICFHCDGIQVAVFVFKSHRAVCCEFEGCDVCGVGQVEVLVV